MALRSGQYHLRCRRLKCSSFRLTQKDTPGGPESCEALQLRLRCQPLPESESPHGHKIDVRKIYVPPPPPRPLKEGRDPNVEKTLKALTSLNKEVRPFFLGDNSIWRFPSVSCLSDYSIGGAECCFSLMIS